MKIFFAPGLSGRGDAGVRRALKKTECGSQLPGAESIAIPHPSDGRRTDRDVRMGLFFDGWNGCGCCPASVLQNYPDGAFPISQNVYLRLQKVHKTLPAPVDTPFAVILPPGGAPLPYFY
ncbi:hypothetical protein [uncultured Alistipes sp.]|uniref:hypothetical protein n=1 Tax=uncultured Alistipes sp. TaxID=538949 RepID=UPI00261BC48E|nr:hypothetical protein [uncultured Alistipes sp.]